MKQYAKAVLLLRRATSYIRESETFLPSSSSSLPSSPHLTFYPLQATSFADLSSQISTDEARLKHDWYAYNGGQASEARDTSRKPLHFDIALNYVQLDLEGLYKRAGMDAPPELATSVANVGEGKTVGGSGKTREDVVLRPETPEPSAAAATAPAKGGLSSLLGGWWGRK